MYFVEGNYCMFQLINKGRNTTKSNTKEYYIGIEKALKLLSEQNATLYFFAYESYPNNFGKSSDPNRDLVIPMFTVNNLSILECEYNPDGFNSKNSIGKRYVMYKDFRKFNPRHVIDDAYQNHRKYKIKVPSKKKEFFEPKSNESSIQRLNKIVSNSNAEIIFQLLTQYDKYILSLPIPVQALRKTLYGNTLPTSIKK